MASEMTSSAADSVNCPVCLNDFTPATINGHLDVCLLTGVADGSPSTHGSEPPLKKHRVDVCAETEAPVSSVDNTTASFSSVTGTPSSTVFSMFKTGKSKVSAQSESSGLFSGKRTVATTSVNKGIKRHMPTEAEPGPAGRENRASGSNKQTLKPSNDLSPRTLLTIDKPLAEILRPNTLEEYFGQSKVVGHQTLFRSLLDSQEIPSIILWGPPGCGKVGCSILDPFIYLLLCLEGRHIAFSQAFGKMLPLSFKKIK